MKTALRRLTVPAQARTGGPRRGSQAGRGARLALCPPACVAHLARGFLFRAVRGRAGAFERQGPRRPVTPSRGDGNPRVPCPVTSREGDSRPPPPPANVAALLPATTPSLRGAVPPPASRGAPGCPAVVARACPSRAASAASAGDRLTIFPQTGTDGGRWAWGRPEPLASGGGKCERPARCGRPSVCSEKG